MQPGHVWQRRCIPAISSSLSVEEASISGYSPSHAQADPQQEGFLKREKETKTSPIMWQTVHDSLIPLDLDQQESSLRATSDGVWGAGLERVWLLHVL